MNSTILWLLHAQVQYNELRWSVYNVEVTYEKFERMLLEQSMEHHINEIYIPQTEPSE